MGVSCVSRSVSLVFHIALNFFVRKGNFAGFAVGEGVFFALALLDGGFFFVLAVGVDGREDVRG